MMPVDIGNEVVTECAKELVAKLYNDTIHPPAKEIGFFLRNITKTFLLLGTPFIYGAHLYDQISDRVFRISQNVPENLRVMPNPQLFLEYLDKTKFIPDGSLIIDAYNFLLESAINKERKNLVHPAFMLILPQLSADELLIIKRLKIRSFKMKQRHHFDSINRKFYKNEIIENEFPLEILHNQEFYFMYTTHLNKLDLINYPQISSEIEKDDNKKQTGELKVFQLSLSEFGKIFSQVCCNDL